MRLSNGDVEKTYQNGYTPVGGAQKGEEDASCTAKCWRMKIAWLPAGMLLGVVFFGAALYFLGQGRSCGDHNLVGGVFCTHYTSHIIGTIPGLSSFYGGMVFLRGDPNTMLVAGYADSPQGAIYRTPVMRDTQGKITAFGQATFFAYAPGVDSSLAYDPEGRGMLFASAYPYHQILQFAPDSTKADYVIDLYSAAPNIEPNIGAFAFVPSGYPMAGKIWIASSNAATLSTASVVWDSNSTAYRLTDTVNHGPILPSTPQGIFFPPPGSTHLSNRIIVASFTQGALLAMEFDAHGIPKPDSWGQTLHFLTDMAGIEGGVMDPVTGDMLFTQRNTSTVIRIAGFPGSTSSGSGLRSSRLLSVYRWFLRLLLLLY